MVIDLLLEAVRTSSASISHSIYLIPILAPTMKSFDVNTIPDLSAKVILVTGGVTTLSVT